MGSLTTSKEYEVHYYEVDYKKRVLLTSIMNYFSDISITQSEQRNVGLQYMQEKGIAWVLYKWDIKIHRYPLFGEKIKVRTNPHSFRKFYAYRKFDILDENEQVIAEANSIWFLIDAENRKPKRIQSDMFEAYKINDKENDILDIPKIHEPSKVDIKREFNIRYSDIDTNGHVNNVKYAAWVIETVPMDIVLNYTIKNISITYEKETRYGETINVHTEIEHNGLDIICKHAIIDEEGKELTIAKTVWNKNN